MMSLGREEALDLLGKWLTESTLLQVSFSFPLFTSCLRGRVFRLSSEEVGFISEDKSGELTLRLDASLAFAFGDSRGTEDATRFDAGLAILFREAGEDSDFISFTEVVPLSPG